MNCYYLLGAVLLLVRILILILFDEKIGGSVHLALGKGYKETLSKNVSSLHWDMIKDLRTSGELYFDGKLVQDKGDWKI